MRYAVPCGAVDATRRKKPNPKRSAYHGDSISEVILECKNKCAAFSKTAHLLRWRWWQGQKPPPLCVGHFVTHRGKHTSQAQYIFRGGFLNAVSFAPSELPHSVYAQSYRISHTGATITDDRKTHKGALIRCYATCALKSDIAHIL